MKVHWALKSFFIQPCWCGFNLFRHTNKIISNQQWRIFLFWLKILPQNWIVLLTSTSYYQILRYIFNIFTQVWPFGTFYNPVSNPRNSNCCRSYPEPPLDGDKDLKKCYTCHPTAPFADSTRSSAWTVTACQYDCLLCWVTAECTR